LFLGERPSVAKLAAAKQQRCAASAAPLFLLLYGKRGCRQAASRALAASQLTHYML
ncbi:hypothetical protein BHM03_00036659, partial [Ensete ventricosum]